MKKRIWIAAAAVALIAAAAGLLIAQNLPDEGPTQLQTTAPTTTAGTSAATAAPETTVPTTAVSESTAASGTMLPSETREEETMGQVETRAPEIQTEPPYVEPPAPTETESPWLEFPIEIPEYELEIQAIRSYDGIYLEDGSDVPISGVAALLVTNRSDRCIDLAKLQLTGEKTVYSFTVTGLASGATAVVMEEGKAPAVEQRYEAVSAEVAQTDAFEMSEGILSVEEDGDALKVTNLTDRDLPCVRIFYKFYLADAEAYVGGITYTAKLLDLKAGASMTVRPSHYAVGSSRVIMAKTYDTDLE